MANSITRFKKNKMRTLKLRLDKNLEQPKNKQSDRGCHEKKCTLIFFISKEYTCYVDYLFVWIVDNFGVLSIFGAIFQSSFCPKASLRKQQTCSVFYAIILPLYISRHKFVARIQSTYEH